MGLVCGSNANGNYVKFADGTQVCTKRLIFTEEQFYTWGNIVSTTVRNLGSWAAVFTELFAWSVEAVCSNSSSVWFTPQRTATVNDCGTGSASRPDNLGNQFGVTYNCFAIGKWK